MSCPTLVPHNSNTAPNSTSLLAAASALNTNNTNLSMTNNPNGFQQAAGPLALQQALMAAAALSAATSNASADTSTNNNNNVSKNNSNNSLLNLLTPEQRSLLALQIPNNFQVIKYFYYQLQIKALEPLLISNET
jgi:hypothetical protein